MSNKKLSPKMAINAAKVKAAQDPTKPGAEKPDLKKAASDDEDGERASGCPDKPLGPARGPRDGTGPHNPLLKAKAKLKKKASLDEAFARDLNQMVGIETEADSNFQRPDVVVAGQATDLIDDHFLGWMGDKADEDVVKESAFTVDPGGVARKTLGGTLGKKFPKAKKILGKAEVKMRKAKRATGKNPGVAIGAGATGLAAGALLGRLTKKAPAPAPMPSPDTGVKVPGGQVKQAGVVENPENLDLMAKIRKAAGEKFTTGTNDI